MRSNLAVIGFRTPVSSASSIAPEIRFAGSYIKVSSAENGEVVSATTNQLSKIDPVSRSSERNSNVTTETQRL
jgi:hypothetical protein